MRVVVPSWRIHLKWARIYGIPEHVASEVNEIIDKGGIHDLGEVKRFGIPTLWGVHIEPYDTIFELMYELKLSFRGEELNQAVKAAILHHFLDKIERLMREYGAITSRDHPDVVVDHAYRKMLKHGLHNLSWDDLQDIYSFLKAHAKEVVKDIVMGKRGRLPAVGPTIIAFLLKEYANMRGYGTFLYVSGIDRPLPPAAAARVILSKLEREGRVTIVFTNRFYKYYPVEKRTFRSMGELVGFLKTALSH